MENSASVPGRRPLHYAVRLVFAVVIAIAATLTVAAAPWQVTAIGRAVGWPDQNYFARRFKAHYGLSATTYRKRFAAYVAAHPTGAERYDD